MNLFEDSDNNVHLKNLSLHQASNEEEGEKRFYQKLTLSNINEKTLEDIPKSLRINSTSIPNSVEICLQLWSNNDNQRIGLIKRKIIINENETMEHNFNKNRLKNF